MKDKVKRLSFFISGVACPSHCIYCNQHLITGQKAPSPLDVERQIHSFLSSVSIDKEEYIEVCFFGGSFTCMPYRLQQRYFKALDPLKGFNYGIRLSTHPLCVNKDVLGFLKEHRVKVVEVGVQSFNDKVLEFSQRGYKTDEALDICCLILEETSLELVIQLMVGLPFQNENIFLEDIKVVCDLKDFYPESILSVRLYPCLVLKGTLLESLYEKGVYKPLTLEEAITLCGRAIFELEKKHINVVRVGLHNEKSLQQAVVGGPFHPSFGQLARGYFIYLMIKNGILNEYNLSPAQKSWLYSFVSFKNKDL